MILEIMNFLQADDSLYWVMLSIWMSIFVVTLFIEINTADITIIWFCISALVSFVLALFGIPYTIQIVVFIVLSLVMLFSFRKLAIKLLNKNNNEKTNTDELIGKTFKLLTGIAEGTPGTIKVHGVIWNVVTEDNSTIKKDNYVEIIKVKGNKFIVKKGDK